MIVTKKYLLKAIHLLKDDKDIIIHYYPKNNEIFSFIQGNTVIQIEDAGILDKGRYKITKITTTEEEV